MRFQPFKCNIMLITRKRRNKIEASYTLEGTVRENVDSIKYPGVTITYDFDMSLAWPAVVQLLVFIYTGIQ